MRPIDWAIIISADGAAVLSAVVVFTGCLSNLHTARIMLRVQHMIDEGRRQRVATALQPSAFIDQAERNHKRRPDWATAPTVPQPPVNPTGFQPPPPPRQAG